MKEKKVKHIFELTGHSNDVTIKELDILISESDKVALGMFNTRKYKNIKVTPKK